MSAFPQAQPANDSTAIQKDQRSFGKLRKTDWRHAPLHPLILSAAERSRRTSDLCLFLAPAPPFQKRSVVVAPSASASALTSFRQAHEQMRKALHTSSTPIKPLAILRPQLKRERFSE